MKVEIIEYRMYMDGEYIQTMLRYNIYGANCQEQADTFKQEMDLNLQLQIYYKKIW